MYIEQLYSDTTPLVQEWGATKNHIVLNVTGDDENGYRYDCVELVPQPITVQNIVKTAAESKFSKEYIDYVMSNLYKIDDEKVVKYNEFVQKIAKQAEEMGY